MDMIKYRLFHQMSWCGKFPKQTAHLLLPVQIRREACILHNGISKQK